MREKLMVIKWRYLEIEPVFSLPWVPNSWKKRLNSTEAPTKCIMIMSGQGRGHHCHDLSKMPGAKGNRRQQGRIWDPQD